MELLFLEMIQITHIMELHLKIKIKKEDQSILN